MPGTHARVEPALLSEPSASDEASHLEVFLQKQLEEDIARIFDESLYSDIEVVCGKVTVLTHSCILKARTQKFYHKLHAILKVKIDRNIFEELYSFISDAYTECNIKQQEKEIIEFLDYNLRTEKLALIEREHNKTEEKEPEVFLTPKCLSPYIEKALQKSLTSSPSTELTKEYYALVHIDHSLEKELIEQDVLSNAFQSIIKTQSDSNINKPKRNKPNSLPLTPSHFSKPKKHSASCDKVNIEINLNSEKKLKRDCETEIVKSTEIKNLEANKNIPTETIVEKLDTTYSPDSLIADDPSSSSDYLSAAYTCSPGLGSISWISHLNVGDSTKMETVLTSSDSGLENTGTLESLTSHKDVTITDISLTESTLQDLTIDDAITSQNCGSFGETNQHQRLIQNASNSSSLSGTSSDKIFKRSMVNPNGRSQDQNGKSSKEEKQRQNEEIVILESSSLSSETGSWESVFPPRLPIKQSCESFLINERKFAKEDVRLKPSKPSHSTEEFGNILGEKSPFKTTSCFIDASSLADEEDEILHVPINVNEKETCGKVENNAILAPSRPLPCSTAKVDFSPNDWSEGNENDDSLEQGDKDPDSIQKDISPTIFEMTPMTEDSLCTNTFEKAIVSEESKVLESTKNQSGLKSYALCNAYISNTPNNSIMSLKGSSFKINESEESDDGSSVTNRENLCNIVKLKKYNESSPIVSGGASIEDYLPQVGSHSGSPMTRRKIENIPIVSGAYIPTMENKNEEKKVSKSSSASAWVVDMSLPKSTADKSMCESKKPVDKAYENIKNEIRCSTSSENSKSRSSVDSDSSERSSQKFYIDLSSLPDMSTEKESEIESQSAANKKNIFSMYIDLGEKNKVKEMPARLSSSLNSKKVVSEKTSSKITLTNKSKEEVPITNTNQTPTDIFEKYEALCNDTNLTISEIIAIPENKTKPKSETAENPSVEVNTKPFFRQINSTTVIPEEPVDTSNEPFVKLSDLDKPIPKSDIVIVEAKERSLDVRMTRSIPDNNWGEQVQSNNSRSIEVISSFHSENALSLNRLFPHLKNEFSRSMPGSLSGRTKSPLRLVGSSVGDVDEQTSSMSEISSVQSSMCRSILENSTTEETSQSSGRVVTGTCLSRLGQDLLRMFLEEIAPDVVVQVSGRRIKAHKCILSSRCQYFAGILSGGWVESAGNVILLPPFSYNVVHFALCHIYSGASTIPDSISIVELATLADMLGLEGLKEAIMFNLKAKYCHHFHKPCAVCTAGVLECFPLSSVYGLDDLYRKCLIWITKYFFKVWPTKAFATLPKELLDKCYQQHIVNLTTDNLVDTVYGCGITVASLQNSRWAESVARMCQRLVNAAAHFAAPRLVGVLKAVSAIPPTAPHPASQALNDCIAAAIEWAPPDETCRAYAFLSSLVVEMRNQNSKPDLISNGTNTPHNSLLYVHANSWRLQCEGALVRAAPRNAFKELPHDLRKRLRALGCIMYGSQNTTPPPPPVQDRKTRSTYHSRTKSQSSTTRSLDIDHVRATLINYSPKLATQVTKAPTDKASNNDLRKSRYKPPAVRTTKAQEERAKFNLTKTLPQERLTGTGKSSTARLNYLENAKPRYLEPRPKKEVDKKAPAKKLMNLVISSSESSRNSSPIHTRNLRTSGLRGRGAVAGHNMSQDSLATSSRPRTAEPSTESLSESQNSNKYATYTKVKHIKDSPECIKTNKGQPASPKPMPKSNYKAKTKIPVCVNQITKPINTEARFSHAYNKNSQPQTNGQAPNNRKSIERKLVGSLMMATKASQAKVVTKIVKESSVNKSPAKINKNKNKPKDIEPTPDIPVMERSGTFLKDEPTFGDKTLVDIN